MRRIPPSLTMKQAIPTLLQTSTPDGHPLDALVRASARYMRQAALGDKPAIGTAMSRAR